MFFSTLYQSITVSMSGFASRTFWSPTHSILYDTCTIGACFNGASFHPSTFAHSCVDSR